MERERVEQLLTQPEGPTLDFKQEWYHLSHSSHDVRRFQRDELVKDIIALANGSATTAGETAYLIIGADDAIGPNGRRELYDVSDPLPSRRELLDKINSACAPALEDLRCEAMEIAGKRLLVIAIPPSPHLHETTRELCPDGKQYQYLLKDPG
jgi:predicted HTH transcriptional regulator